METLGDILGFGASVASGGLFGLIGSGLGVVAKYFQTRADREWEEKKIELDMRLFDKQMESRKLETEMEIAVASSEGAWAGLRGSVSADKALAAHTGPLINGIKSLFRPFLTTALKLGESKASADISVNLKKSIRANVKIAAEHVDLDKWLALPTDTGKPALTNPMKNITVGKSAKQQAGSISRGSGKKTAKSKASAKSDPAGINTVINLSVQSVTFKQGLIHKTRLSAEISGGE